MPFAPVLLDRRIVVFCDGFASESSHNGADRSSDRHSRRSGYNCPGRSTRRNSLPWREGKHLRGGRQALR